MTKSGLFAVPPPEPELSYQLYVSPVDYKLYARCSCREYTESCKRAEPYLTHLKAALFAHLKTHGEGINFLLDDASNFTIERPVEHQEAIRQAELAGLFGEGSIHALRDALETAIGLGRMPAAVQSSRRDSDDHPGAP